MHRGREQAGGCPGAKFPLPVEIIPMAAQRITASLPPWAGTARLRMKGDAPLVTDNGQHILDVTGLSITDPLAFESQINQWPGVVTVGRHCLPEGACLSDGDGHRGPEPSSTELLKTGCPPGCWIDQWVEPVCWEVPLGWVLLSRFANGGRFCGCFAGSFEW